MGYIFINYVISILCVDNGMYFYLVTIFSILFYYHRHQILLD